MPRAYLFIPLDLSEAVAKHWCRIILVNQIMFRNTQDSRFLGKAEVCVIAPHANKDSYT